jgi:hypothetical protein
MTGMATSLTPARCTGPLSVPLQTAQRWIFSKWSVRLLFLDASAMLQQWMNLKRALCAVARQMHLAQTCKVNDCPTDCQCTAIVGPAHTWSRGGCPCSCSRRNRRCIQRVVRLRGEEDESALPPSVHSLVSCGVNRCLNVSRPFRPGISWWEESIAQRAILGSTLQRYLCEVYSRRSDCVLLCQMYSVTLRTDYMENCWLEPSG